VRETGLEGLENSQNPQNQGLLLRNKTLPKSKLNILTTPQNPKTNFLKMPEFKAKIYVFCCGLWAF
jgi:hypothetical protein